MFFNDHSPAHVHAVRAGAWVVILIDGAEPVVRDVHEMKQNDVARALDIAAANLELLKTAWRKIHGPESD